MQKSRLLTGAAPDVRHRSGEGSLHSSGICLKRNYSRLVRRLIEISFKNKVRFSQEVVHWFTGIPQHRELTLPPKHRRSLLTMYVGAF
jgi:hypothetical protein